MLNTKALAPQQTRGSSLLKLGSSSNTMPLVAPCRLSLSLRQREVSSVVSKWKPCFNVSRRSMAVSTSKGAVKENASAPLSKSISTDLEDLVRRRYFDELFTGGDYTLAAKILDPGVVHRDMVRDEMYSGVDEVVEFIRQVKQVYPSFSVHATEIAPCPDDHGSLFVAFEGHTAEGMPLFRGIDRFYFTESKDVGEKKIKGVEVYRSNWQGAKGHEQRKKKMEEKLRREEREAEEKRKHKKH
jgi:hypothetical protein